jgi:hypothetical protein
MYNPGKAKENGVLLVPVVGSPADTGTPEYYVVSCLLRQPPVASPQLEAD